MCVSSPSDGYIVTQMGLEASGMDKIKIFQTAKTMAYIMQQAKVLPVRQLIVLDLLLSVFCVRNKVAPKERARAIAAGDYSFLKCWLDVDLKRLSHIIYPKGCCKRPWEARAGWIKSFAEEAKKLCEVCEAVDEVQLDGTVLAFKLNSGVVVPLYDVKMPSPLEVPVCLYRMPDSRISPNAFSVNKALICDRKMNRNDQASYGIKLRSFLHFTGLESPLGWKRDESRKIDGQRMWFYEYVKRAVEGYKLFGVSIDLSKAVNVEYKIYITPKFDTKSRQDS